MSQDVETTATRLNETFRTVLWAALIAFLVRTFFYEPFNIPSGSMLPTLEVGDFLFVSKYSYGYSSRSIAFGMPLFDGRVPPIGQGGGPQRGDIAVFKKPSDNTTDYIKRIIGLPGDRIQMIDGVLHINGAPVPRERIGPVELDNGGGRKTLATLYIETLPGGKRHYIAEEGDNMPLDNTPEYTVPEGHYFAMGDNRDNSQDSRVMRVIGFVPAENLVGRAERIFFSLKDDTHFWEIWRWPFELRFTRLFQQADQAPDAHGSGLAMKAEP